MTYIDVPYHITLNIKWIKYEIQKIKIHCVCLCEVTRLCPTLCDPVDYSTPGSSVHSILQARILEWVTIPFSRESSRPRDQTQVSYVSCIGRWVLYH